MDRLDPSRLLVDSLGLYSPSSEEDDFASFLKEVMGALGYSSVRTDSAGNVLGEIGNGPPSLLLCGHIDTVPGMLPVKRTRTHIYGRGASDAKGPLCALLLAGSRCADSGLRFSFAGVTREESDSHGVRTLLKNGPHTAHALFGEPAGSHKITVGYRGRIGVSVTLATGGGHASAPWANVSAFDEFQSLLSRMNAVYAHTSGYDSVSVSATTVKAGSHPNVIPNRCDATVDVRIPPRLSVKEVVSRLKGAAKGLAEGTRLTMAFTDPIEAYETPGGSLLARSLRRSIIRTLKSRPVSTVKTGTGDMNIFGSTTSADCVTYGPGRPEVAHSNLEFIEISDYERSIDVLSGAIGEFGELLRSESQSR